MGNKSTFYKRDFHSDEGVSIKGGDFTEDNGVLMKQGHIKSKVRNKGNDKN